MLGWEKDVCDGKLVCVAKGGVRLVRARSGMWGCQDFDPRRPYGTILAPQFSGVS